MCKDNANERNVSLLTNCRVQLILCKDKGNRVIDKALSVEFTKIIK